MVKSLFDTNVLIDYLDAVPQAQDELTRYRKLRGHTSAAVLLGTGAGIAFFMLVAHRTGNATAVAAVARIVLSADFVFTTKAGTVQPITGIALARKGGYSLWDWRIFWSIILYLVTGVFGCRSSGCR